MEEASNPFIQPGVHRSFPLQIRQRRSRTFLSGAGGILVHLVEEFEAVAKMKMVCSVDDLESIVRAKARDQRKNTRLEVDEYILPGRQDKGLERIG